LVRDSAPDPSTGAGQPLYISGALFNGVPFLPPPITLTQCDLIVTGNRIRIMIDASRGAFVTYGQTIAKVVVTYEQNQQARN